MEKLQNQTLNKIYKSFMQKKDVEEYKPTKLKKILNRIPVINDIILLKNIKYADDKETYIYSFFVSVMNSLCLLYACSSYYNSKNNPDLYLSILFFVTFIMVSFFAIPYENNKLSKEKLERFTEETLTKEDFDTVINNCNKKIVSKVIENNKGELRYKNLFELDELLSKEKESLEQIEIEAIQEVWKKIDKKTMLEKFKDKDSKAIIEEFSEMGLEVTDGENVIREKRFLSKIVATEKKEEVLI